MDKNPESDPNELSVLDMAWEAFQARNYKFAREQSIPYLESENENLTVEAKKLVALTYFHEGKFSKSQELFEEICKTSKNPDDWFNLVTSATLNSQFDVGKDAYSKALEFHSSHGTDNNISIPYMMLYYLQSLRDMEQFAEAFIIVKELGTVYSKIKITDRTFLFLRGVPGFGHFIDAIKPVLEKMDSEEVEEWKKMFTSTLDEEGQELVQAEL